MSNPARYLVDSDWLIDALADVPAAREPLLQAASQGVAICVVTVAEVYEGAFGFPDPSVRLAAYRAFLAPFPIPGLTDPIVERFARERSRLRRAGRLIPDFDLLIAVTALHHGLILLTRNERHFTPDRFPDLELYRSGRQ